MLATSKMPRLVVLVVLVLPLLLPLLTLLPLVVEVLLPPLVCVSFGAL